MKKEKKKKKCTCQHNIGSSCNASFCWCEKHWEESIKAGFVMPNNKLNKKNK